MRCKWLWGSFEGRLGSRHTSSLPHSVAIVADGGVDVCDGAHSLDVMKEVKGPAQAKLVRGTLRGWNGREVRATLYNRVGVVKRHFERAGDDPAAVEPSRLRF